MSDPRLMKHPATLLGVSALLGLGLVTAMNDAARHRMEANEYADLLKTLESVIPADRFDNDLLKDATTLATPGLPGTGLVTLYRARRQGKPAAVVLNVSAPDGYGGNIRMLVAVERDGLLAGVRVIKHRETPGLGDLIETEKSDWIHSFDHRSLDNPPPIRWKVKRDGGDFDQFAGATITPRAIVKTVRDTLDYVKTHQQDLFDATPVHASP